MDGQTRFIHPPEDRKLWEKAAIEWASKTGHPKDRALSAWIRVTLNQAAEQQLKDSDKKG